MTNRNELERFVAAYNDYTAGEFGNDAITVEEALRWSLKWSICVLNMMGGSMTV